MEFPIASQQSEFLAGRSDAKRFLNIALQDRVTRGVGAILMAITIAILVAFAIGAIWRDQSELARVIFFKMNPSWDGGTPEAFNHGMAFLAAGFLLVTYLQTRARVFLFLTALYGFIWFDDSAQYHETAGGTLGLMLQSAIGFHRGRQPVGELAAWAIAGLLLLMLFLWFWRDRRPGDTGVVLPFFLCFALLLVCGVFFDMLHVLTPDSLDTLMQLIEDGGEMIAIAASAALAVGIARNVEVYYRGVEAAEAS